MKKNLCNFNLKNKTVVIRVDFNVPIKNGKITSEKRIVASLSTIKKVLEKNAKVVLLSHLGRVKTEIDKKTKSLLPVAKKLSELLNLTVQFCPKSSGTQLNKMVKNLRSGQVLLVENTRFEDLKNKAESKNNLSLAKKWANLADVFINDAFATAHRKHASNYGIASLVPKSGLGFLVENEIKNLKKIVDNPERPYVALIGGAKVSDKIEILNSLLKKADKVLIGGGMCYAFLKAQNREVGTSLLEGDKVNLAKKLLKKYEDKILLPIDHGIASGFDNEASRVDSDKIPIDKMSLDIGPKTVKMFSEELRKAKTIFWNGPMGVFEFKNFAYGTDELAKVIARTSAFSVIGGGDSIASIEKLNVADKISHISTGGGASLEFIQGKKLPALEIIKNATAKTKNYCLESQKVIKKSKENLSNKNLKPQKLQTQLLEEKNEENKILKSKIEDLNSPIFSQKENQQNFFCKWFGIFCKKK